MIEPRDVFGFKSNQLQPTQAGFCLDWQVPSNLPYFQHPTNTDGKLPSVAILDASIEALRTHSGLDYLFAKSVQAAEFAETLEPLDRVRLSFSREEAGEWRVVWTRLGDDRASPPPVADLRFHFR
jgi:hypothetical protein